MCTERRSEYKPHRVKQGHGNREQVRAYLPEIDTPRICRVRGVKSYPRMKDDITIIPSFRDLTGNVHPEGACCAVIGENRPSTEGAISLDADTL